MSLCNTLFGWLPCCPFHFSSYKYEDSDYGYDDTPSTKQKASKTNFEKSFNSMADENNEITAEELQVILNETFENDLAGFVGFDKNICRSLVALSDDDLSGRLGYEETKAMFTDIDSWRAAFGKIDRNHNGYFHNYELQNVLKHLDVKISAGCSVALMHRYQDQYGHIKFEDFLACMVKLTAMLDSYECQRCDEGTAKFHQEQFMQLTMYS